MSEQKWLRNRAGCPCFLLGLPVLPKPSNNKQTCNENLVERCVKKRTTHQNRIKKTHKTLISVSVFINDTPTPNRWSRSWSLLKRAVAGIAPHHWPGGMHEAIKYPLQGRRMAEGPKIKNCLFELVCKIAFWYFLFKLEDAILHTHEPTLGWVAY